MIRKIIITSNYNNYEYKLFHFYINLLLYNIFINKIFYIY